VKQFLTVNCTFTSRNFCKHETNDAKEGKVYPITVVEDPDGEYSYSSTFSLTLTPGRMGGQRYAQTALPPRNTRYPMYRRLGGPQGRAGRVRTISSSPEFDPGAVQLAAKCCADFAISAQV
jgi:hypothetical protein